MTAGRIVIHIGAPKTGSTYLQRRLRVDPARLRAYGIHVPVPAGLEEFAGNAKLLASVLGAETRGLRALIDVDALDPREVVDQFLSDWRIESETLVLSAEDFRPPHARLLRELLPTDAVCTPVLVVRNQYRWFASNHQQRVKLGRFHDDVSTLVKETLAGNHYCPDWLLHYTAWSDVFGDCRVVFYESASDDLVGAFLESVGLSKPPDLPEVPREKVSLDSYGIAYLLEAPRPATADDNQRRQEAARAASRHLPGPRFSFLTAEDEERIRDRFEGTNRRLLEILGRSYAGSPLDLSAACGERATLDEVYASVGYADYRRLAEAAYADPDRLVRDAGPVDRLRRLGRRVRRSR